MSLADQLRAYRERAGLSQEMLAERAGVSARTISDLERGIHRSARRTTIKQIVTALGLSPDDARALELVARASERPRSQPVPPSLRQMSGSPVVGRAVPLAALEAAAQDSRAGRGSVVALTGDSGIGKTRLVRELAARAAATGDLVLHGRLDGPDAPPLRAIRTAFADLIAAQGAVRVAERAGWAAPQLASLLPELRPVAGPPAPVAHRSELFDASAALLRATFQGRAGIIVLDDISWADDGTWAWIEQVGPMLSELSLLLVVVARTGALPSADADRTVRNHLARLARLADVEQIELAGLDRSAVAKLVRNAGIGSPALAARIADISEGNPLLVDAMAKQLAGRDRSFQDRLLGVDASWPTTPVGIRTLVDRQLEELDPQTACVVEVASVIGPDIDRALLGAVAGVDEAVLTSCLDAASGAGILEPVLDHHQERWTFRHPILRIAAADRMRPARRAAVHHLTADRLWPTGTPLPDGTDIAWIAAHLVRGLSDGADPDRSLLACDGAAAQAGEVHAWEAAAAWLEQAVVVARRLGDRATEARILLGLGNARILALQRHLARPALLEATDLALRTGQLELIGPAAEGYARMTKSASVDPGAERLWCAAQSALTVDPDPHASASVAVLAAIAIDAAMVGDPNALIVSDEAMRLGARSGPTAFPVAATTRAIALWPTPRVSERLDLANRLVDHAEQFGDEQTLLEGLELRGVPLLQQADGRAFDVNTERLATAGDSQRHRLAQAQTAQWRAMRAMMAGDMSEAARRVDEAIELAGDAPNFTQGWAAQQFVIQRSRGRHLDLLDRLVHEAAAHPDVQAWGAMVATTAAEAGEKEVAREALESLLAHGVDEIDRTWTRLTTLALCAEAAWRLDEGDAAILLQPALSEYDGLLVVVASGTSCEGAVAGYLGLLDATLRAPERAGQHLVEAERLERRAGGATQAARTHDRRRRLAATGPGRTPGVACSP